MQIKPIIVLAIFLVAVTILLSLFKLNIFQDFRKILTSLHNFISRTNSNLTQELESMSKINQAKRVSNPLYKLCNSIRINLGWEKTTNTFGLITFLALTSIIVGCVTTMLMGTFLSFVAGVVLSCLGLLATLYTYSIIYSSRLFEDKLDAIDRISATAYKGIVASIKLNQNNFKSSVRPYIDEFLIKVSNKPAGASEYMHELGAELGGLFQSFMIDCATYEVRQRAGDADMLATYSKSTSKIRKIILKRKELLTKNVTDFVLLLSVLVVAIYFLIKFEPDMKAYLLHTTLGQIYIIYACIHVLVAYLLLLNLSQTSTIRGDW